MQQMEEMQLQIKKFEDDKGGDGKSNKLDKEIDKLKRNIEMLRSEMNSQISNKEK